MHSSCLRLCGWNHDFSKNWSADLSRRPNCSPFSWDAPVPKAVPLGSIKGPVLLVSQSIFPGWSRLEGAAVGKATTTKTKTCRLLSLLEIEQVPAGQRACKFSLTKWIEQFFCCSCFLGTQKKWLVISRVQFTKNGKVNWSTGLPLQYQQHSTR